MKQATGLVSMVRVNITTKLGLSKLKIRLLFGLDSTSGVEVGEAMPNVSDKDPIRSTIGQGTNIYTPVQLSKYISTLANRGTNYKPTFTTVS